jgi:hypothetical protein
MSVFKKITKRTAIHVRRFGWTGRVSFRRHELPHGERHYVLWLGWTALTVLRSAPSLLPAHEREMYRVEIDRIASSLRTLKRENAPADVVSDTMGRLLDAYGRQSHAERLARPTT